MSVVINTLCLFGELGFSSENVLLHCFGSCTHKTVAHFRVIPNQVHFNWKSWEHENRNLKWLKTCLIWCKMCALFLESFGAYFIAFSRQRIISMQLNWSDSHLIFLLAFNSLLWWLLLLLVLFHSFHLPSEKSIEK